MTERPTVLTRIKKVAAFLAIVWGVAGSFVLFDVVFMSGADRLAGASDKAAALSLSAEVRESPTCRAVNGAAPRASVARPVVQATAWSLGVQVGARSRWSEVLADGAESQDDPQKRAWLASVQQMVQQTDTEVNRLAAALAVPRPTGFAERHRAIAPREFVTFVESDAQATPRSLTIAHGPRACQAYKMGEYWGYSMMSRDALPGERNVFSAEIGHYASELQVPDTLWRPMVARTPSNATTAQLSTETVALTNALTRHFSVR